MTALPKARTAWRSFRQVENPNVAVPGTNGAERRGRRNGYAAMLATASLLLGGSATAAPLFTMAEVLAPVNGSEVRGRGINNSGQVSGTMGYNFGTFTSNRAFIWNGSGSALDLGTLGSNTINHARSDGYTINNSGQVAGWSQTSGSGEQSFRYSGGVMSSIDTASSSSNAYDINNLGQVTGVRNNHAYFYNGSMLQLGTLTGGTVSLGTGINDNGTIVGWGNVTGGTQHAFVYSSGVMTDIGMLPGASNSSAAAINNAGLVVGTSTVSGTNHAFLYNGTTMTDLGVGTAMDINSMMGGDAKGAGDSHAYEELMKQMQQMMGGE